MSSEDKKYKKPHAVEGWPFGVTTPQKKANAIRRVAEMAARKVLLDKGVKPTHDNGDPTSPYPGDQPEAYDPTLTQQQFDRHFTGKMDDISAIMFSDGTQIHGKLKDGFVPLKGWTVDEFGFVVLGPHVEACRHR